MQLPACIAQLPAIGWCLFINPHLWKKLQGNTDQGLGATQLTVSCDTEKHVSMHCGNRQEQLDGWHAAFKKQSCWGRCPSSRTRFSANTKLLTLRLQRAVGKQNHCLCVSVATRSFYWTLSKKRRHQSDQMMQEIRSFLAGKLICADWLTLRAEKPHNKKHRREVIPTNLTREAYILRASKGSG